MHPDTHVIELEGERVEESDLLAAHECHPITDARARIGRLADEVRVTGRPVLLTRHGRPAVAVVSAEDAMRLLALRRAQERRGFAAARAARDAGAEGEPIEDVVREAELHRVVLELADEGKIDGSDVQAVQRRLNRVFGAGAVEAAPDDESERKDDQGAVGERSGTV